MSQSTETNNYRLEQLADYRILEASPGIEDKREADKRQT